MITLQIGLIIFFLFLLVLVSQDEYKRRKIDRKSGRLEQFWQGGKERRKDIRINKEISVFYEITRCRAKPKKISTIKNLSMGGVNILLPERLSPGTQLKIELNLNDSLPSIRMQGEVVWTKEVFEDKNSDDKKRHFAAGIKFLRVGTKAKKALESFIEQNKDKDCIQEG